jgi:hypothetical protein
MSSLERLVEIGLPTVSTDDWGSLRNSTSFHRFCCACEGQQISNHTHSLSADPDDSTSTIVEREYTLTLQPSHMLNWISAFPTARESVVVNVREWWWRDMHDATRPMRSKATISSPAVAAGRVEVHTMQWIETRPDGVGITVFWSMRIWVNIPGIGGALGALLARRVQGTLRRLPSMVRRFLEKRDSHAEAIGILSGASVACAGTLSARQNTAAVTDAVGQGEALPTPSLATPSRSAVVTTSAYSTSVDAARRRSARGSRLFRRLSIGTGTGAGASAGAAHEQAPPSEDGGSDSACDASPDALRTTALRTLPQRSLLRFWPLRRWSPSRGRTVLVSVQPQGSVQAAAPPAAATPSPTLEVTSSSCPEVAMPATSPGSAPSVSCVSCAVDNSGGFYVLEESDELNVAHEASAEDDVLLEHLQRLAEAVNRAVEPAAESLQTLGAAVGDSLQSVGRLAEPAGAGLQSAADAVGEFTERHVTEPASGSLQKIASVAEPTWQSLVEGASAIGDGVGLAIEAIVAPPAWPYSPEKQRGASREHQHDHPTHGRPPPDGGDESVTILPPPEDFVPSPAHPDDSHTTSTTTTTISAGAGRREATVEEHAEESDYI